MKKLCSLRKNSRKTACKGVPESAHTIKVESEGSMKVDKNIIGIMERALNSVDFRLIDHGKRVAYLVYKVLEQQNLFSRKELHDICTLALLHDVGAYKTEEIDRMVAFETTDVWEHSVYGYMFLKYLSPLSSWAPIILYHHAESELVKRLKNPRHQMLAQLIHLCDRADIHSLQEDSNQEFIQYINQNRDVMYMDGVVNMYLEAEININNTFCEMLLDEGFDSFLYSTPLSMEATEQYLQMTLYSIYFVNEHRVSNAYASTRIGGSGGRLFKLRKSEGERLIENNFVKNLEEIGIQKKVVNKVKKMKIYSMNISDYNFLDDILMLANLFDAFYELRGYRNSSSKEMVAGILSDLIVRQGLKPDIVALIIEEYHNIAEKSRQVKPSAFEVYKTVEKPFVNKA